MDRSDLELVTAIRQHGSLATTAKALHVAPPSITKRLAALEAELGLRLFQRTTRRVSPTAEGDALCERAVRLLAAFEELEADLEEAYNAFSEAIKQQAPSPGRTAEVDELDEESGASDDGADDDDILGDGDGDDDHDSIESAEVSLSSAGRNFTDLI